MITALALLLGLLIIIAYGSCLDCSWQYDDFSNIIENDNAKLTSLSWQQLKLAMYDQHLDPRPSRPLARLSFALNYFFGGNRVQGYHLVNIIIHLATAFVLWTLVTSTIRLVPALRRHRKNALIIGWIGALFWATHPIQVTAVTYIVQRMASMAAFFYLAAMLFYLKARTNARINLRWGYGLACCICGAAAMASKENAFMLPASLLLYDVIMFPRDRRDLQKILAVWGAILVLAGILVGWLMVDPASIVGPWENRPFTPGQRLLTEPRVIWQYLGLLAVPSKTRLNLLHDVGISTGLFSPPSTLIAITGLTAVLAGLVLVYRKWPLVSFSGLFFLLNHLIEGSVFNLELIYEHRNYLPSTWLFVLLAIGMVNAWNYFSYRKSLQWSLAACWVILLSSQIHITLMYNRSFKSELSLWMDVVRKSPEMSLAHNNLGKVLWNAGLHQEAYRHFVKALVLDRYNDLRQKGLVYYNLGLYELEITRNYKKAADFFKRALSWASGLKQAWYQSGQVWLLLDDPQNAETVLRQALKFWPDDCGLNSRLLLALAKQPQKRFVAMVLAGKLVQACRADPVPVACIAEIQQRYGNYQASLAAWLKLEMLPSQKRYALIGQLELFGEMGKTERMNAVADRILAEAGLDELKSWLDQLLKDAGLLPHVPKRRLVLNILQDRLQRQGSRTGNHKKQPAL